MFAPRPTPSSFAVVLHSGLTGEQRKARWTEARSWYLQSQNAWSRIDHPNRLAPNSFHVGDPTAVAKELKLVEILSRRRTSFYDRHGKSKRSLATGRGLPPIVRKIRSDATASDGSTDRVIVATKNAKGSGISSLFRRAC